MVATLTLARITVLIRQFRTICYPEETNPPVCLHKVTNVTELLEKLCDRRTGKAEVGNFLEYTTEGIPNFKEHGNR